MSSTIVFAQENLFISFNSKVNSSQLNLHPNEDFSWNISDSNNVEISSGLNNSINDYVFATPGKYKLKLIGSASTNHSECNHGPINQTWIVNVADIAIQFNLNQISFQPNLSANSIQAGVDIEIPLSISIHPGSNKIYNTSQIRVAMQGVDCNVNATITNPTTISHSGNYILKVNLKGAARSQTYIMIDFIDLNGNISTYYHLNQI
jgi:hypothetical protein